jgi:beta-lactam-binding protein with PASTA domain
MYSEKLPAFSVVEQNPHIDMEVKPGRTIYLTINSGNKPKIKAPKLTDMSITLAKAVLKNRGFELGSISYTYDEIGNNLVVEQFYRGRALEAGTLLPKGSTIDLKVASTDRQYQSTTDSVGIINDEDVSDEFGI